MLSPLRGCQSDLEEGQRSASFSPLTLSLDSLGPAFPCLHSVEGGIPRSKQILRLAFYPRACLAVQQQQVMEKRLVMFDFP